MRSFVIDDQPLFLTAQSLGNIEKVASFKLSRDPAKWEQEIMGFLHEENPFLQDFQDIRLNINKTDQDTGMGTGQIMINNKLAIPLIVDSFKLQPLDLFWFEDKLHPLTKPAIMSALQGTTIGKPIEQDQGGMFNQSMYTDSQPPRTGRYSFASSLEFTLDELQDAMSELGRDGLEYALKSNSIFQKTAAEFAANASEKPMEKKASHTRFITKAVDAPVAEEIDRAGAYHVKLGGMKSATGFVFDRVIDFNDNVLEGLKLFRSADGETSFCDSIGGVVAETGLDKIAMDSDPFVDGFGFFWSINGEHAIATTMAKVLYTGSNEDGMGFMKIASAAIDGRPMTVYASEDYEGLLVSGDTVFMGPEWHWASSTGHVKVASADKANTIDWPTDFGHLRFKEGRFHLEQLEIPELCKEGSTAREMYDALDEYFDSSELLGLMKTAEDTGHAFFEYTEESLEAVKEPEGIELPYVSPALIKCAAYIQPVDAKFDTSQWTITKTAVEVDDDEAKSTVDSLLGLNFITKDNMHKFIEKIDTLTEAQGVVARLLLASRLGLQVDSSPLRTAMFALNSIIKELRELRNTLTSDKSK